MVCRGAKFCVSTSQTIKTTLAGVVFYCRAYHVRPYLFSYQKYKNKNSESNFAIGIK